MSGRPFVVQLTGPSGSGKTRALETVVRRLVRRRLRVAVVKHSHHSPDLSGKDTGRYTRAGARIVVFASDVSFVAWRAGAGRLLPVLPVDVVLVEGYSRHRWGDLRLRLRVGDSVAAVVSRILAATPHGPTARTVVVDGRARRADPLWRLVANVLEVRGANEVRRVR